MAKTLGLDLGTNSIGLAIRNDELAKNQFEKFAVTIFKTGVGNDKSGEYSFAAERTKKRSTRRLYQARKYRIWETLKVLMKEGFCPISEESLTRWVKYDKAKAKMGEGGRTYPTGDEKFEQWVKLDFNGDGKPDYDSPYQLRKELATLQFDFTSKEDRFKLGRALYHISQRRGFKSSKGETLKEQEKEVEEKKNIGVEENETTISLKKSEQKKSGKIQEYIETEKQKGIDIKTIGWAFAELENKGERIRENWLQHSIRQQYEDEIKFIFSFQKQTPLSSSFHEAIHKAIFFRRPLRSQKGLVGKCTLEPQKSRCPISHPNFEYFRAWSLINNIRVKKENNVTKEDWQELGLDLKQLIYNKIFMRLKNNFVFSDIADFIVRQTNIKYSFNYKHKTNVSGCPASARLKNLLGENWRSWSLREENRTNKTGETYRVSYNWEDIWHVWFNSEDEEFIEEYAAKLFKGDPASVKQFITGWATLPVGYGMLSMKAIRNINVFLAEGLIYTDAVLLAKMPEILGADIWKNNKALLLTEVRNVIESNRNEKLIYNIVNTLISKYKTLDHDEKFAYKNTSYKLAESDTKDIKEAILAAVGAAKFEKLSDIDKNEIISRVTLLYQEFFFSSKRDYYKLPRVVDTIIAFLTANFPQISEKQIHKLYHPSLIQFYTQVKEPTLFDGYSRYQLPSPKIGSFKNPMAMRTLHELRKLINYLLKEGQIDEETRVVVETARELNDANKRWAIEAYQRQRAAENKEFETAIIELLKDSNYRGIANPVNEDDIDKLRLLSEQFDVPEFSIVANVEENEKKSDRKEIKISEFYYKSSAFLQKVIAEKDLIKKYRLWKEQQFRCIYTGRIINITDLFNDNVIDFEHTIPRSISLDNSLENLTVCFADFNRNIKKKRIPSQLDNHDEILGRIKIWEEKTERIIDNVEFWKKKSKGAATKEFKDKAIRQRHLWQMELDYWQKKVERFKIQEVTTGFRNSQLVDTQLISKYAFHYLKTVFQKVEVQKGQITAEFRKIYGIQQKNEKKDRSLHSHHAKDAAILTLIPTAAKRDEILQKSYAHNEETKQQYHDLPYKEFERNYIEEIDSLILINNSNRDKALTIGKKNIRKHGKIVYTTDEQGNKNPKLAQGDCIRGQLHQETFLGANKVPKVDENGKWLKDENNKVVFENELLFVKREPFVFKKDAQSPGFNSLEDIEGKIVDKSLFAFIEKHVAQASSQGKTFKDVMIDGIWHKGKNGMPTRIRHIRVKASAKDPLTIKMQSHISQKICKNLDNRTHKQYYYAANSENYCFALYQGFVKNKIERAYELYNLFDIANLVSFDKKLIVPTEKEIKKGVAIPLYAVLKNGQRVLFYKDIEENIESLTQPELSKRLYRIFGFESDGRLDLQHHLDAKVAKAGEGQSTINFDEPHPILRITKGAFNFLIEKKDFEVLPDGRILFR